MSSAMGERMNRWLPMLLAVSLLLFSSTNRAAPPDIPSRSIVLRVLPDRENRQVSNQEGSSQTFESGAGEPASKEPTRRPHKQQRVEPRPVPSHKPPTVNPRAPAVHVDDLAAGAPSLLPRSVDYRPAPSAEEIHSSTRQARVWPCQVTLIHDIEVPAPESGLLVQMEVRDEQVVERGQLLALIDSRQQCLQREASELERDAATTRAADEVEIRYAEASYDKSKAELDDALAINKRNDGAVTQSRLRELRLECERTRLQVEKSKLDLKVAGMTAAVHDAKVKIADEAIERRKIVAPIDGEVVAVKLQSDEWVNAGDSVYRIIRLDRLRVEGLVNVKDYNPSEIHDRPVTVEVELAHGQVAQFTGRVTHIDPIVKSQLFRVRAEVDNRQENGHWLLQSGRDATMIVHLP